MNFIKEVDALDADIIVFGRHHIRLIPEILDIDDGNLLFSMKVVDHLRDFNVTGEGAKRINQRGAGHLRGTCRQGVVSGQV